VTEQPDQTPLGPSTTPPVSGTVAAIPPWARRHGDRLILAGFILVIALLRLHTYNEPIDRDAADYLLNAENILKGHLLYVDIGDQKPPAIHLTFALAILLAGYGPGAMYLLGVTAAAGTVLFLYAAVLRATNGNVAAGLWAAAFWTVVSGSLVLEANQPNTEAFQNLCLVGAVAAALPPAGWRSDAPSTRRAYARSFLWCGVLIALGSMYKQVVLAPGGLILAAHVLVPPPGVSRRRALFAHAVPAGAIVVLTWAGLFGYYAAIGHLADLKLLLFTLNKAYAGSPGGNLTVGLQPKLLMPDRLAITIDALMGLAIVGGIAMLAAAPARRSVPAYTAAAFVAYAVGVEIAIAAAGTFFMHYYQLWLPLWCAVGAIAVLPLQSASMLQPQWLWRRIGWIAPAATLAILIGTHAPNYALTPDQWSRRKYGDQFVQSKAVGLRIGGLLLPQECFYEWGNEQSLYVYSQRDVASTMVTGVLGVVGFNMNGPAGAYVKRFAQTRLMADLARRQPELFVLTDVQPGYRGAYVLTSKWFHDRYEPLLIEPVDGRFYLYERRGGALAERERAELMARRAARGRSASR
jgi:hypothetical protein